VLTYPFQQLIVLKMSATNADGGAEENGEKVVFFHHES
jgi:hypothetical protein